MDHPADPSFDAPDLAERVEELSAERIHRLPFGAVRLDTKGLVVFFSEAETRLSGYGDRPTLGLSFFTDIAPCLASDELRRRIESARAKGELDLELEHVGDFDDAEKVVHVRVLSASDGGLWAFLRRP